MTEDKNFTRKFWEWPTWSVSGWPILPENLYRILIDGYENDWKNTIKYSDELRKMNLDFCWMIKCCLEMVGKGSTLILGKMKSKCSGYWWLHTKHVQTMTRGSNRTQANQANIMDLACNVTPKRWDEIRQAVASPGSSGQLRGPLPRLHLHAPPRPRRHWVAPPPRHHGIPSSLGGKPHKSDMNFAHTTHRGLYSNPFMAKVPKSAPFEGSHSRLQGVGVLEDLCTSMALGGGGGGQDPSTVDINQQMGMGWAIGIPMLLRPLNNQFWDSLILTRIHHI